MDLSRGLEMGKPQVPPLRFALSKNIPGKGPLDRRSLHYAPSELRSR
jgi:hypothetical protein